MVSRCWYGPAVVAAAGCLLAVAGCGDDKPQTAPRSSVASPSLSARQLAESKAITAYTEMWNAFVEAARTADAQNSTLPKYASGDALKSITDALTQDHQNGKVIKGRVRTNPTVASATPADRPTQVALRDCADDSEWLVYWQSGRLVNNVPGGRHNVTAIVKNQGGGWKVVSFTTQGVGTCS